MNTEPYQVFVLIIVHLSSSLRLVNAFFFAHGQYITRYHLEQVFLVVSVLFLWDFLYHVFSVFLSCEKVIDRTRHGVNRQICSCFNVIRFFNLIKQLIALETFNEVVALAINMKDELSIVALWTLGKCLYFLNQD